MESRGIFQSNNAEKRINRREVSLINNDDKKKSTKSRKKSKNDDNISNDIVNDNINFESNNTIVISIVENRAREICISKLNTIDMSKIELYLTQDNHGYTETMSLINDLQANEILLHDGSKHRIIAKKIEEYSKDEELRILYISRQYFDQDRGADMLKKVIVGNVDRDLIAKYTVLAGTYCLLRYIENCQNITFPNHSLRIEYASSMTGRCNIDRRTSLNLELINNTKNGSQKQSLFGVINYTRTLVGARLLKTNILRPSTGKFNRI
jgi:DNA mismatch repair protein MSH4